MDFGFQNQGRPVYDGKRMRKHVERRTVDYQAPSILHMERRVSQRDRRDYFALQPVISYKSEMQPAFAYQDNPASSICSHFIKTSTNKERHPVNQVVWTPDGRRLITGASSGEFTLWNGLTFNFDTLLQAHISAVRSMIWSHDEEWMVSGDGEGHIKYWQPNMNNVKEFQAHSEAVRGLAFSPTDMKLASCSDDVRIKIWDFARCSEELELKGHGWDIKCVAWHPSKSLLVSGSKDNLIKIWDPKSGENIVTLHGHKNTVQAVLCNNNGNWLLSASRDQLLKLYDFRMMRELQSFRGHSKEVTAAAWHPVHEEMFCSGGHDGSILYWNVGQEKPQAEILMSNSGQNQTNMMNPNNMNSTGKAHDSSVWSLAWHPAGHILCSGSNDHNTKFWCRNRPGDTLRDHGIGDGNSASDTVYVAEHPAHMPTNMYQAPSFIPGIGSVPINAYR